jgi:hypothetical protein
LPSAKRIPDPPPTITDLLRCKLLNDIKNGVNVLETDDAWKWIELMELQTNLRKKKSE